jgi:phosphoglycolate phosphatase
MIKLLIFDLDGTLVDTRRDIANSVNYALNTCGLPDRSLEEVTAAVGEGIIKLIERCIASFGPRAGLNKKKIMQLFKDHYLEHCIDNSQPYPGVMELLGMVQCEKAVLSNKPHLYCQVILEQLKMDGFFSMVVGGDTEYGKKPNPAGAESILRSFNLSAQEALMIGDSGPDVLTAKSLCMPCVGICKGMGKREQLISSEPDYLVERHADLGDLFKNIGVME